MKKTEAQKRADAKWEEKNEDIRVRVPKGTRDKVKRHAEKNGETMNQWMNRIIQKELKQ